ncbi:MAG TPA: hypothetical protein VJ483_00670 [Holophagaceae bacterium]|nr:hypothetical protein [Holophagaceae bacterium]
MDTTPQTPSPEEKSSFQFGLWSLLTNLVCCCFPVSIVLGILSITKYNRAMAAVAAEPERYASPKPTGMVLGILGMCWTLFSIGIVAAIAIPALLGQRGRARDKAAVANMIEGAGDLVSQFDRLREAQTPLPEIPARLETQLRSEHGLDKNPWNPAAPAFSFHIRVVSDLDRDGVEQAAAAQAGPAGQVAYVLELPTEQQPGYLAGAVRMKFSGRGSEVQTKVMALE